MNKRSLICNRTCRTFRVLPLIGLLLTLLASCERRPLELEVEEDVRVKLLVKWKVAFEFIYGIEPTGMTVMLWGDNAAAPQVEISNSDSVLLKLEPDRYRMIIFNQTFSEFPYLGFYDTSRFDSIAARSLSYTTRAWNSGTTNLYYPDPMAVAVDSFTISKDMVHQDSTIFVNYNDYVEDKSSIYSERIRYYEIPETPYPMTVTLFVKAKVKRRQSIKSIEASLSGLAEGFYMSKVNRTREGGTMELNDERWKRYTYGEEEDSMGYIVAEMPSFGLPYGKELRAERDSLDNVLKFHFTLIDGETLDLTYHVGKDIQYITPDGEEAQIRYREDLYNLKLEVDLTDVMVMPYKPPVQSGAGFNAEVAEWEEGPVIDLGTF
ncbi:MAG: DUF5119 domain-containing protein [Bacteroidaceae bacterium]|nr:DUF5119 domain-containing protein [Bacteroidaceae bacterium]